MRTLPAIRATLDQACPLEDDAGQVLHDAKCMLQELESEKRYAVRWNVYHTILCAGVWIIAACCVIALWKGWGLW